MPAGRTKEKLSKIISSLSKKYSSPTFRPHVTLAGGIAGSEKELTRKAEKLSKTLKPFTVHLGRVRYLDEFFRSLFIAVKKTPEYMDAYEKSREVFDLPENHGYLPHMSLIYGDFSRATKEEIIKKTGRNFHESFEARRIFFVFNNEKEKKWTVIKKFSLKSP